MEKKKIFTAIVILSVLTACGHFEFKNCKPKVVKSKAFCGTKPKRVKIGEVYKDTSIHFVWDES